MKKTLMLFATLGAGLLAVGSASAGTVTYGGVLDGSSPTFTNPLSATCVVCSYDVQEFTVDTDGLYTIDAFYPGDTALDENMDGYLILYSGAFDPADAATGILASDDDGPGGSNTSQILDVALTAGTSYFLVTTTFDDIPTSFGQPSGPFENTISGPGDITLVPIPAAVWLFASAILGLGAMRRRG